ncbi:LL-diaminopimelate aminotransferase [Candidatus Formimonas warabiya]|uniref:Aminotransferase n=1 Tax=Formimonas warabiya TaxID=1761012 RepID=A0A3G1KQ14_FORW1|nr:LL-diaminopimelate aminotransferase [Candidatus Formimonas warabiya]ATW24235.1 LL-diaminopimelate aminotransferase [Candidatus Formimonas warabiya]
MKISKRLSRLDAGIFSELDQYKNEYAAQGGDIINLSIGSPDQPPAPHIMEALKEAVCDPRKYGYALTAGLIGFKQAIADWYLQRFDVVLDPEKEILSLMGSQDGLGHIFLALLDGGDIALIPDPGYPIYSAGVILAEGNIFALPLLKENNYLPDLDKIPEEIARKARIMVLNYPNNPLTAVCDKGFFEKVVYFAKKYEIIVCHDVAYSELSFDGFKPASFLEVKGAKDVGVEFHSLSKTFNLAGCRIAFMVGKKEIIGALEQLKSNIDYGIFQAVQLAGIAALSGPQDYVKQTARTYQHRRDTLIDGLASCGWAIEKPKATMFVWAPLPSGFSSSKQFAQELLQKTGIVVTPGIAFGQNGEGYVRIALVADRERLTEAVRRIEKTGICGQAI